MMNDACEPSNGRLQWLKKDMDDLRKEMQAGFQRLSEEFHNLSITVVKNNERLADMEERQNSYEKQFDRYKKQIEERIENKLKKSRIDIIKDVVLILAVLFAFAQKPEIGSFFSNIIKLIFK
ncbi:MAG: hypothetical protein J7J61_04285 [Candidatus Hydrothermae bacterium]|nr:hypothetical protein [Candidatus Hydrothermae bacterium]